LFSVRTTGWGITALNVVKSISTTDGCPAIVALMFRFARRVLQYTEQIGISNRA